MFVAVFMSQGVDSFFVVMIVGQRTEDLGRRQATPFGHNFFRGHADIVIITDNVSCSDACASDDRFSSADVLHFNNMRIRNRLVTNKRRNSHFSTTWSQEPRNKNEIKTIPCLKNPIENLILFLGANPDSHLKLENEVQRIKTNLKLAGKRDNIKFTQEWSVTADSLIQSMLG